MSELREPTQRELIATLFHLSNCLRRAASQWKDIPGRTRVRLMRCAVRGERVLARIPAPTPRRPRQ